MKHLIIGQGYIGNNFKDFLGESAVLHTEKVTSQDQADRLISRLSPEWVINAAGVTGKPNVDWCEDHKQETYFGNVLVPLMLARSAKKFGAKMMHIGSGCVYQGDNQGRGFSEEDKPNFTGSYYSFTKAEAEQYLQELETLQLRLRMPLDGTHSPRNLLEKVLGYVNRGQKIVLAQNSISYIPDFLNAAKYLMDTNASGIFNTVQSGSMDHKQLLDLYQTISGIDLGNINYCTPDELNFVTKAPRSNCVLSVDKLNSTGYSPLPVQVAMKKAIREHVK